MNIQTFIWLLCALLNVSILEAQTFQWVKTAGGEDLDLATDMVLVSNNDMIICGEFNGTADIDPDTSIKEISTVGDREAFLARYDDQGNFIWAVVLESSPSSYSTARSLALDSEGNIIVLGVLRGTVDLDPSANTEIVNSAGAITMFLLKFTSTGQLIWQSTWKNTAFFSGVRKIALDDHDNIYIGGGFASTVDIGSNGVTKTLNSIGKEDALVASYDKHGDFRWAFNLGSAEADMVRSIDVRDGELVVGGFFGAIMDIDPDLSDFEFLEYKSGRDGFVAVYDTSGNYIRSNSINGIDNIRVNAVMYDLFGNIVITGEYKDEIDFIPGFDDLLLNSSVSQNVFFTKYNALLEPVWAKSLGNGHAFVSEIAYDKLNQIYLTGSFNDSLDFNPGTSEEMRYSLGGQDIYVAKYSESGNYVWSGAMEGMGIDDAWQVCVNDTLEVAICGSFESAVDFNAGWGEVIIQSQGKGDIYIAKYGPEALSGIFSDGKNEGFQVYPIPFNNSVFVTSERNEYIQSATIFDLAGNKLWETALDNRSTVELNLSFLNSGYYLMQIQTSSSSETVRIIKE